MQLQSDYKNQLQQSKQTKPTQHYVELPTTNLTLMNSAQKFRFSGTLSGSWYALVPMQPSSEWFLIGIGAYAAFMRVVPGRHWCLCSLPQSGSW